ncbi:MAG: cytochrome [Caulobacter sp.]|nr:cytochrome [Caulobacter sp.]
MAKTAHPDRYSTVAILLHWLIAAMIVTNVGYAWYANGLHGLEKIPPLQIHKSIGISILLLTLARLAWRLVNRPPPMPADLKPWERLLARTVHVLFYVVMIGLPLTGWAMVSASPTIKIYPINFFGYGHWPAIQALSSLPHDQMKQAHGTFETAHGLLAKLIVYLLIPLHIAGALKHQFIDKDNDLARMLPFLRGLGGGAKT